MKDDNPQKQADQPKPPLPSVLLYVLVGFFLLLLVASYFAGAGSDMPYSKFEEEVLSGRVEKVVIFRDRNRLIGYYKTPEKPSSDKATGENPADDKNPPPKDSPAKAPEDAARLEDAKTTSDVKSAEKPPDGGKGNDKAKTAAGAKSLARRLWDKGNNEETFVTYYDSPEQLLDLLHAGAVKDIRYKVDDHVAEKIFMFMLIGLLALILWRTFTNKMGASGSMVSFMRSRAKLFNREESDITFGDVAGIDEAKEELKEVVEFLKSPKKFQLLGGKIPKGVLLVGSPGTGKTLLAKAVAGEAGVPFFSLSGSEFVEMFVGLGAARVRDLFQQANSSAPCIVFIDELDALGKTRGISPVSGDVEREQTLNQLLVEMDGFDTNRGVIIMAATNRPETLDAALLRPGRFDRHVVVDRPDLLGREAILKVHAKNVKLDGSIDLRKIAAMTPGLVGADLANLINEAALLAARGGKEAVTMSDIEEAVDRVVAGLEKKKRLMSQDEKRIVAYHEAGHALVANLVEHADPVHKISMIPRGLAALGYTMQLPTEDRYLLTRSELLDRMACLLGGRVSEEVVFEEISTGAVNDLQTATEIARRMVSDFGMSRLGPVTYRGDNQPAFLPEGWPQPKTYSDDTARMIDGEIKRLVEEARDRATALLTEHRDALEKLAQALIENEVIEAGHLKEILAASGIKVKERRHPESAESGKAEKPAEQSSESIAVVPLGSEGKDASTDTKTDASGTWSGG
ncbi:MAG TPA: ATP-dependent zinc metalloprotease FtsH [Candidatus Brocadiia bacterium]|nr:ATP-dependent zinc metalloprotease FtsH [Candidatus Brocadiia bacterium]